MIGHGLGTIGPERKKSAVPFTHEKVPDAM